MSDVFNMEDLLEKYFSYIGEYGIELASAYLYDNERELIVKDVMHEIARQLPSAYYSRETGYDDHEYEHAKEKILEEDRNLFEHLYYLSKDKYSELFYTAVSFLDETRISSLTDRVYEPNILVDNISLGYNFLWESGKSSSEIISVIAVICKSYFQYLRSSCNDVFEILKDKTWQTVISKLREDPRYDNLLNYAKSSFYEYYLDKLEYSIEEVLEEFEEGITILGALGHPDYIEACLSYYHPNYRKVFEKDRNHTTFHFVLDRMGIIATDSFDYIEYLIYQSDLTTIIHRLMEIQKKQILEDALRSIDRKIEIEKGKLILKEGIGDGLRPDINGLIRLAKCLLSENDFITDLDKSINFYYKGVEQENHNTTILGLYFMLKFHGSNKELVEETILDSYNSIKSYEIKQQVLQIAKGLEFSEIKEFILRSLYFTYTPSQIMGKLRIVTNEVLTSDSLVLEGLVSSVEYNVGLDITKLYYIFDNYYHKSQDYLIVNFSIDNQTLIQFLKMGISKNTIRKDLMNTIIACLLAGGNKQQWIDTIRVIMHLTGDKSMLQLIKDYSFKNDGDSDSLRLELITSFAEFDTDIQTLIIKLFYLNKDNSEFKSVLFHNIRKASNKGLIKEDELEKCITSIQVKTTEFIGKSDFTFDNLFKQYIEQFVDLSYHMNSAIDEVPLSSMLRELEKIIMTLNKHKDSAKVINDNTFDDNYASFFNEAAKCISDINYLLRECYQSEILAVREKLETEFGAYWSRLTDQSKLSLETAEYLNNIHIRDQKITAFEYSTICLGYCKAWEYEIWDKILNKFINRFKNKKLSSGIWPYGFKTSDNTLKDINEFKLSDAELILNWKGNKSFDVFLNDVFKIDFKGKMRENFCYNMRDIRKLRNNTAHAIVSKDDLLMCRNRLLYGDRMFQILLSWIK